MNKIKRLAVKTLSIATAVTVMSVAKTALADTCSGSSETAVAGVSLSLDKYYAVAFETTEELLDTSLAKQVEKEEKESSKYENVGISIASSYVNIRKTASVDGEIVGKLYEGSAATIKETKGEWVKISSGSVEGYIKKEYLAIGVEAEKLVDKYANQTATVNTTTLYVREKKSVDSVILTMIAKGTNYEVVSNNGKWVEIMIDSDIKGYVSADYVDVEVEFDKAISIKEEKEKLKKQQEAEKAAAEKAAAEKAAAEKAAAEKAAAEKAAAAKKNQTSSKTKNNTTTTKKNNTTNTNNSVSNNNTSSTVSSSSNLGQQIASYAQRFVGRPYVYGGNSLTNGTDCSGFVKLVYAHFGYSLTRTASSQAVSAGTQVSINSLKPGDLIFYAKNGSVSHVALYIGNNKVVHASTPKSGIKISNMNYRTPYMARRVVN